MSSGCLRRLLVVVLWICALWPAARAGVDFPATVTDGVIAMVSPADAMLHSASINSARREARNGSASLPSPRASLVRGICYSPTPIGNSPIYMEPFGDFFTPEYRHIWQRDIPKIADLGATSLRIYGWNMTRDHTEFLDYCGSHGLNVLITVYLGTASEHPVNTPASMANTITQFAAEAERYRGHPAVLGFSFGNEINAVWNLFVTQFNEMGQCNWSTGYYPSDPNGCLNRAVVGPSDMHRMLEMNGLSLGSVASDLAYAPSSKPCHTSVCRQRKLAYQAYQRMLHDMHPCQRAIRCVYSQFFAWLGKAAASAHRKMAPFSHLITSSLADVDALMDRVRHFEHLAPSVDFWGAQLYRGKSFAGGTGATDDAQSQNVLATLRTGGSFPGLSWQDETDHEAFRATQHAAREVASAHQRAVHGVLKSAASRSAAVPVSSAPVALAPDSFLRLWPSHSAKPLVITEYGVDSYRDSCGVVDESLTNGAVKNEPWCASTYGNEPPGFGDDEVTHADWVQHLSQLIMLGLGGPKPPKTTSKSHVTGSQRHRESGDPSSHSEAHPHTSSAEDESSRGYTAGGFLMSWVDEFWKGATNVKGCHSAVPYPLPGFDPSACDYKGHVHCPTTDITRPSLCGYWLWAPFDHYTNEVFFGLMKPSRQLSPGVSASDSDDMTDRSHHALDDPLAVHRQVDRLTPKLAYLSLRRLWLGYAVDTLNRTASLVQDMSFTASGHLHNRAHDGEGHRAAEKWALASTLGDSDLRAAPALATSDQPQAAASAEYLHSVIGQVLVWVGAVTGLAAILLFLCGRSNSRHAVFT